VVPAWYLVGVCQLIRKHLTGVSYICRVKRSLIAILAVFYLVISSGFTVNFHYCMGKLKTVKLQAIAGKLCGCKAGENNKCCKSEYKLVKLQSEHKSVETSVMTPPAVEPCPLHHDLISPRAVAVSLQTPALLPGPPLIGKDIYIANRVFRI
jgi:hypothetical protein